jgi:AcrR family transcriptional regulator
MNTKARIVEVALRLFNEQGTGAVSTNHIADAAGISPGNLYYHFRNKEAIIRAIFEQMFAETDVIFNLPTDRPPTLEDVRGLVQANFTHIAGYCFVYRELLPLLRQDADLHRRYLEVRERGYTGFREIIAWLATSGILQRLEEPSAVTRVADICWMISEFWLASAEVSGAMLDESHMQRGIDLMMQVIEPYLSG